MSSNDDSVTEKKAAKSNASTVDDPRVTPLGGNAGVHIRTDEEPDDVTIDFGAFLVSMGTSCLVNLGRHADPETGNTSTDMDAARQMIHILEMLRDKTQGNLTHEEEQLLTSLLHDLHIAYAEAAK